MKFWKKKKNINTEVMSAELAEYLRSESEGLFTIEEVELVLEHYSESHTGRHILNIGFHVVVLPVIAFILADPRYNLPLSRYSYCPDKRIYTFRRLSKDSPGLSPPLAA